MELYLLAIGIFIINRSFKCMRSINFLLLLFLAFNFIACTNETEQERKTSDSDSSQIDESEALNSYSNKFRNIVKTDKGAFRGIELGMSGKEVKEMEDSIATPDQTENDTLDYILNYNFPETAEVIYYTDKKDKVSRIQVDIYPESIQSQLDLYNEFERYFRSKYGDPLLTEDKNGLEWKVTNKGFLIRLRKQGNEKIHDLQIDFTQIPVTSGIPS
jgi:hypothetical protein